MLRADKMDLKLDESTHDLVLTRGDVEITDNANDVSGIAQDIKIAVQMIAGEYFYDLDQGIALYRRDGIDPNRVILGARFSKARVIAEFNRAIFSVEGVSSIISIDVRFDTTTRKVSVSYKVKTVFGDTVADSLTVGGGSNA